MRRILSTLPFVGLLSFFLLAPDATVFAAEKLNVPLNKTEVLQLERPATVVAVANPAIADVSVQSPTVVIVTGKTLGETTLNILDRRQASIATLNILVVPDDDDQITINHGADAVKTLNCQPRCIRVGNPGKDPEPGKSGGGLGGKSGGKGGGLLGAVGGGAKK